MKKNTESSPGLNHSFVCVIPVYNNAGTIFQVVERVQRFTRHILLIDDGSTDVDLAKHYRNSDVEVIRHPKNLGKGAALRTALNILQKRQICYMLTLDADGQHYPEDIPLFYDVIRKSNCTLAVGCRDFQQPNVPLKSKKGRSFSNYWIARETGLDIEDTQSGFRLYPVAPLASLNYIAKRYNFETEILTKAAWQGIPICNIAVRTFYPPASERVSHFRLFRDNILIAAMHLYLLFLKIRFGKEVKNK